MNLLLFILLATIPGAMAGGSFSPGDYAWGQNGLDDIITQVKKGFKSVGICSITFSCDLTN